MRLKEQLSAQFDSFRTIQGLAVGLVERDPYKYGIHKYLLVLIAALGLRYWEGYYFHRYPDDILDGDIECDDPVAYVKCLREQVVSRAFSRDDPISRLGERYLTFAQEHNPFPDRDPWQECLRSIDGMQDDYDRSKERTLLSKEELDAYYNETFDSVLTIAEMLIGAPIAPSVKQLLISGQGEIYSLRDLSKDWHDGILNIPKEVLDSAGLYNESSIDEVRKNTTIQRWAIAVIDNFTTILNSKELQRGI